MNNLPVIDGIHLYMESKEFSEHCARRADFHSKRNEFYLAKVNEIRNERRENPNPTFDADDIDAGPKLAYSNSPQHVDPVAQLERTAATHRQKAERFRFMSTHAANGGVYKLDLNDLTYLEIGA